MEHKIEGGNLPVLRLAMNRGERVYTDKGDMCWMSEHIKMETTSKGGFLKGLARKFSGENFFLNTFEATENKQELALSPPTAGEIKHVVLNEGDSLMCQKNAFMCAEESVELKTAFQKKLSSGLFGGEGFILQRLTGHGNAFLEIDGALIEKELKPGEVLRVDQGYVAYFDESVKYEITRVKGVKNMFLGGEGLFLVKLTGPGKVGLQTLPLSALAKSLAPYMPTPEKESGLLALGAAAFDSE